VRRRAATRTDSHQLWVLPHSPGHTRALDLLSRTQEAHWFDTPVRSDKESAFAIGGGYACVQGAQPSPPSPTPAPSTCEDIVTYCDASQCATKSYLIPVCQKTCGCCGSAITPSYCK